MPVDSCQLEPALDKPGSGVCRCAASARERHDRAAGLSELRVAKDRPASMGHLVATSNTADMHRPGGLVDGRCETCGR